MLQRVVISVLLSSIVPENETQSVTMVTSEHEITKKITKKINKKTSETIRLTSVTDPTISGQQSHVCFIHVVCWCIFLFCMTQTFLLNFLY